MGWSWPDLLATPPSVIDEGFELMEEAANRQATQHAQKELQLKALKAAKQQRGR